MRAVARLGGSCLSAAFALWLGFWMFPAQPAASAPLADHTPVPTTDAPTESGEAEQGELVLPDLVTLPPFNLRVVDIPSMGRRILRFSNAIANAGPGTLEVVGERVVGENVYQVRQRLFGSDGVALAEPVISRIRFDQDHEHYHMDEFSRYELWSLTSAGAIGELMAVKSKVSYCLMDTDRWTAPEDEVRRYASCYPSRQGLSPGWMDNYQYNIAGQWLDITGLPPGPYLLRSIADPADQLRETDDFNNEGQLVFWMDGAELTPVDPLDVSWLRDRGN